MEKAEISAMEIAQSKLLADGSRYFSLFDKHIPELGAGKSVLIYAIDNLECIASIVNKNPSASYVVYGSKYVNLAIQKIFDGVRTIDSTVENSKEYNLDMKFDCIIMNPPYEKNLHLKILAEAIKHLKDDYSKVINLSPSQWLDDTLNDVKPRSDYNKFKHSILDHISYFESISAVDANSIFNIGLMANLGLYECVIGNGKFDYQSIKWNNVDKNLFTKLIITEKQQFPDPISYDEHTIKVFVPIKMIANPYATTAFDICTSTFKWIKDGKLPDGRPWKEGIFKSKSMNDDKHLIGFYFNTELEAKNFYYSTYTKTFKFANKMVKGTNQHVNVMYLPWMGDAVNPRTGLKGYASEWTNEDFYQFFSITDNEKKMIEDTMVKKEESNED